MGSQGPHPLHGTGTEPLEVENVVEAKPKPTPPSPSSYVPDPRNVQSRAQTGYDGEELTHLSSVAPYDGMPSIDSTPGGLDSTNHQVAQSGASPPHAESEKPLYTDGRSSPACSDISDASSLDVHDEGRVCKENNDRGQRARRNNATRAQGARIPRHYRRPSSPHQRQQKFVEQFGPTAAGSDRCSSELDISSEEEPTPNSS